MPIKQKANPQTQIKQSFQWGISSRASSFMHNDGAEAAREGSEGCHAGSPLPQPKRKASESSDGGK